MAQNTRKKTKQDIVAEKLRERETTNPRSKSRSSNPLKRLEEGFQKYQKLILGLVVGIALVAGGYYGFKHFIVEPKEEKAATALSYAQQWFIMDSFNLAINGDGINKGALEVSKQFKGTKAGNLANFYMGVSYLHLNDPQKAISYLEKFDGKGTPIQNIVYGTMGDAYMEVNKAAKGIEYYKKAAADKDDDFLAPLYLFRAGLASELNGNKKEAKKLYERLKSDYPNSQEAQEIDKYLARLGVLEID